MSYSAFSGFEHIASGSLAQVYAASSHIPDCMIFDRETGRVTDVDPRFPPQEDGPRPGRPESGCHRRAGRTSGQTSSSRSLDTR